LFSVIIPTCNRPKDLLVCIESLLKNVRVESISFEIIISDDTRKLYVLDSVKKALGCHSNIHFVNGPMKGPAANRNNGARYAKGEWLIFLDDDCIPSESLLDTYYTSILKDVDCQVFEGAIVVNSTKVSPLEYAPVNEVGGKLWSCNFMIKKDLFWQIGGFDENFLFPHMEDVDLRSRISETGEKILFLRKAFVYHPLRRITNGFKLGKYQAMYIYYKYKHAETPDLFVLLTAVLRTHYAMAKGCFYHRDILLAPLVLFEHIITILFRYRFWIRQYKCSNY
jgi:GT2 family glycosyltransferase